MSLYTEHYINNCIALNVLLVCEEVCL